MSRHAATRGDAEAAGAAKRARPAAPVPVVEMPGHLLRRCQQIAVSIFLQEARDFDLTPLQYAVLATLDQHGALDQGRLGGLTALDRTTIGVVIAKLEGRGLVARRRAEADRRFNAVTCTEAGRALLHRAEAAVATAQERILAPLAAGERRQFLGFLRRIAEENNDESRAPHRP